MIRISTLAIAIAFTLMSCQKEFTIPDTLNFPTDVNDAVTHATSARISASELMVIEYAAESEGEPIPMDTVYLRFDNLFSNAVTSQDRVSHPVNDNQIAIKNGDYILASEYRKYPATSDRIAFKTWKYNYHTYLFKFIPKQFKEGYKLRLLDNQVEPDERYYAFHSKSYSISSTDTTVVPMTVNYGENYASTHRLFLDITKQ